MPDAMYILTSEQMRNIDRRAIDEYGIPSIVLMENAATGVVDVIERHFAEAEGIAIFCGTGNNGGDGFAVARHLLNRGFEPHLFLAGTFEDLSGDARINYAICGKLEIACDEIGNEESLLDALVHASEADLVIDALFGTGLNRPIEGLHAELIRSICELRLPVLAIDVPSGLMGSSREVREPVIEADVTVTFAHPKIPHVFPPASWHCGEVIVVDISIPDAATEAEQVSLSVTTPLAMEPFVIRRAADTHKGTYGHVALLCGSEGKSGAAILAARGAVRAGAGLVTVITDHETARIVDAASIESMSLSVERAPESISWIIRFLEDKSAALIGPGLPDDEDSYAFIRSLATEILLPLVIDATGINAFAGQLEELNPKGRPRVITPHPGELARLVGVSTDEISADRLSAAGQAARDSGCIVVLKGHQTLIAAPDGRIAVNPTGNPGMASGGMGDVLAGLLAGMIARGESLFETTRAAVYLHGLAGDLVRDRVSDIGMSAAEVADAIPAAIEQVRSLE